MRNLFNSLDLIDIIYIQETGRETCVDMELRRANPYVYSEIKENNSSQRTEGVDYDFYADAGATESGGDALPRANP